VIRQALPRTIFAAVPFARRNCQEAVDRVATAGKIRRISHWPVARFGDRFGRPEEGIA